MRMMRKFALVLSLLISGTPGFAWIHGSPGGGGGGSVNNLMVFQGGIEWPGMGTGAGASPACPKGSGFPDDGCAAAPAPLTAQFQQANSFQPAGYFNTVAGTTANYMATTCGDAGNKACRPPWNVAGVDYAIGNYTPPASMLDPATNPIPGCVFKNSGTPTGGNIYECGDTAVDPTHLFAGVVQHVNFGPIGGHGCTAFLSSSGGQSTTGSLLIDDFYWFNDTGLCSWDPGAGFPQAFNASFASFPNGITVSNGYMDGNSAVYDTVYGGCAATTQCNPTIALWASADPMVVKYVALRHFAGRPVDGGTGTNAANTYQFDWIEDYIKRPPNGHAQWFNGAAGNPGSRLEKFDHIVQLQAQNVSPEGPAPIFWANNWPFPIDNFVMTNNTLINSFIGGMTKNSTAWGCIGSAITVPVVNPLAPICTGAGNTFFLTSQTGKVGFGAQFNGTCANTSLFFQLVYPIAGPYPDPSIIGEFQVDGFNPGEYAPGYSIGPSACTNVAQVASVDFVGLATGHGPTPFGASTIGNNYIDASSQSGAPNSQDLFSMLGVQSGITASVSGTTLNVTSASSIRTGVFINGAGVTGCSTDILHCPTVVTGGTGPGTFTLNTSGGSVSSEAMNAVQLAWCTTPTAFSGNIDMAHLILDANVNQWNVLSLEVGC